TYAHRHEGIMDGAAESRRTVGRRYAQVARGVRTCDAGGAPGLSRVARPGRRGNSRDTNVVASGRRGAPGARQGRGGQRRISRRKRRQVTGELDLRTAGMTPSPGKL